MLRQSVAALAIVLVPALAHAANQTVTETHTYLMGDSDTRSDALHRCQVEAKRKVLDRVGALVISDLDVRQDERAGKVTDTTSNRMRSYVSGNLKTTSAGEHFDAQGDRQSVTCSVNVSFNPEAIRKDIQRMADEEERRSRLPTAEEAFGPDTTPPALLTAEQRAMNIMVGMTAEEVIAVAGQPRYREASYNDQLWSYGKIWVTMRGGRIVECISTQPNSHCRRDWFAKN